MTLVDRIALLIFAAVFLVALGNRRGLLWITCLAASYYLSGFYWRSGGEHGELVAGLCDAAVIVAILLFGAALWEFWLGLIILLCLGVNVAYLTNNLLSAGALPHEVYAITLEVLNLFALALIGGVSAFMQKGSTSGLAFHPWEHIFGFTRPFGRAHR